MLLIACPGAARATNSSFVRGQSSLTRPEPYDQVSDRPGGLLLFTRVPGVHYERWTRQRGLPPVVGFVTRHCNHQIHAVYQISDPRPDVAPEEQ